MGVRRYKNVSATGKEREATIRSTRRRTVYRMTAKKHDGEVPCFVCGKHVREEDASLEHILPLSKGGTDEMGNLAISHERCNNKRGSTVD